MGYAQSTAIFARDCDRKGHELRAVSATHGEVTACVWVSRETAPWLPAQGVWDAAFCFRVVMGLGWCWAE